MSNAGVAARNVFAQNERYRSGVITVPCGNSILAAAAIDAIG
jgi:hypothetical protein